MLIARDKVVQTLDYRLGKLEQTSQKTEDILRIMHNQAVIDRKEISDKLTNLFNKLNPPSGTAQSNGVQNLGVASGASHGMVPTQVIPATQGGPVDQTRQKTTGTLRVDLTGVQPTGLHLNGMGVNTAHPEQLNTERTLVNGREEPLTLVPDRTNGSAEGSASLPNEIQPRGAEEGQAGHSQQMDVEVLLSVDPDMLVLQQSEEPHIRQAKTGEVRVFLFEGSADSYLVWHQQMIAYVHQNNLMRESDLVATNFLQQKLKPKSAPQLMLDATVQKRKAQKEVPLTFGQQMGLLKEWFEPKTDGTSHVAKLVQIQWDGKQETLKDVMAQIMHANIVAYPEVDSMPWGIVEFLNKVVLKYFQVAKYV